MIKKWLLTIGLALFSRLTWAQLPDFVDLAEKQGAAVVNIIPTQVVRGQRFCLGLPFDEDEPAFEFL
jgi:MoaA/NifB/PqqE/SkfB family radical SAM enzyme